MKKVKVYTYGVLKRLGAVLFILNLAAADETERVVPRNVTFSSSGSNRAGRLFLPDSSQPVSALIVSHGAGDIKEHYEEMGHYLAERGVAVFAIDMYGSGQSEGPRYYVDMKIWAADIRAAVDFLETQSQIDPSRIAAFGHSSGGTAILEASLTEPRLKALITLDATTRNSMPFLFSSTMRVMSGYGRIKRLFTSKDLRIPYTKTAEDIRLAADPEANDKILDYFKESGAYLPLPGGRQAFFVNTIKRVHKVAVPTLVIWGEKDELDPVASGKLLYEKLTCIKSLEIVAENGHVGFVDSNREKVMNVTAKWLQTYLPPIPKANEMIGRVPNF